MEKNYINFKVKSPYDQNIKAHLRMEFKNAQKIFTNLLERLKELIKNKADPPFSWNNKADPPLAWQ